MQDRVIKNSTESRAAVLSGILREGLLGKVTCKPRLQEMRRRTCRYQMEERSGREGGRCKGPEAAVNLCLRASKEASVAGME